LKSRIKILRFPLGLTGLIFIAYLVSNHWGELAPQMSNANAAALFISACLGFTGNILMGHVFSKLLCAHGTTVPLSLGLRIFLLSQIAKYIPGKIWSYLFQMAHLPTGTSLRSMFFANLHLMISSLWCSTVLGANLILISYNYYSSALTVTIFGILISVVIATGLPWVLLRKLQTQQPTNITRDVRPRFDPFLLIEIWISCGMSVAGQVILVAFGFSLETQLSLSLVGIGVIVWVVSALLVVFPAGLGVREWLFIKASTLSGIITTVSAPITLSIRFWLITIDLTGGLFAIILSKKSSPIAQTRGLDQK